MLFQVAVIEPELVDTNSEKIRDEQVILDIQSMIAPDAEGAKIAAILAAKERVTGQTTDPKRWKVIVKPFA